MARNVFLWINDQRVDLNDDALIQFNYLQTDLDNPTAVRNSYSHTVTLPATDVNNRIFGSYFRLDRVTGTGFNPMVRTPFAIYDEKHTLLESGYLKLDKVMRKNGGIYSYSVNLYGGLGGFFYRLTATDDGEPLNLGDLRYVSASYSVMPNDPDAKMYVGARSVADAWREACGQSKVTPSYSPWTFFLQFAPCYNGIPDNNFDANKCIVNASSDLNVRDFNSIYLRSGQYAHKDVTNGCVLVTMATPKDEWVMRDFRAYLQRPVVSVREVFRAIPYTISDYRFSWSNGVDDIIKDLWLTLVHPKADANGTYPMRYLFDGSISPAQLLVGIAKTFGFVFRMTGRNEIEVFTREEYYNGGVTIDITSRVDFSKDVTISPYAFDAKFYVWKNDVAEGGYAKEYKERYGKDYGQLRVNTNYQFSDNSKNVLDKLAIRSGVMSVKQSQLLRFINVTGQVPANVPQSFVPAWYEEVKYRYYTNTASTESAEEVVGRGGPGSVSDSWFNYDHPGFDIAERLQLTDSEGKPIDGANILLYKGGYDTLPSSTPTYGMFWHVTDDDTAVFNALNEGVPCYDLRSVGVGIKVERIPRYSRYYAAKSLDFGYPLETSIPWLNVNAYTPIYYGRWAWYFSDRMDKDTKVLRCWVNLEGMQVGQDLLRNLYYYANSLWCLTKVENYVLGRVGATQCEFVKVQDIDNYKTE